MKEANALENYKIELTEIEKKLIDANQLPPAYDEREFKPQLVSLKKNTKELSSFIINMNISGKFSGSLEEEMKKIAIRRRSLGTHSTTKLTYQARLQKNEKSTNLKILPAKSGKSNE